MGIFISSLLSLISLPLLILSSIVFVRFPEFACTYVHEKKRVESEEKWGKKGWRVEKSCRNNRRFEGVKYACAVNMAYYYSRRGPITILFFLKKIFRLSYQNAEWRSSTKCSPFLEAIASLLLSHSAFINFISHVFLSQYRVVSNDMWLQGDRRGGYPKLMRYFEGWHFVDTYKQWVYLYGWHFSGVWRLIISIIKLYMVRVCRTMQFCRVHIENPISMLIVESTYRMPDAWRDHLNAFVCTLSRG